MLRIALALSAIDHSDQAVINANPNTQERNPMSPNVGNFVHDLVEMAKAMETLPQVEQALREAEQRNRIQADTIDCYRADLEQSRTYAASLEQKVRTVEAERDDADIRFLELEEKSTKAVDRIRQMDVIIGVVTNLLDPPKLQPEPVVEALPQGQSDLDPTPSTGKDAGDIVKTTELEPDWKQDQAETSLLLPSQPPVSQDQSEVNPHAAVVDGLSQAAHIPNVSSGEAVDPMNLPKPSGPYTGKLYHDYPAYVTLSDWIDGSGTEQNYFWRPHTF